MRRRIIVLAAVGAVAVTALFFLFLLRPKLDQISEVRAEIQAAQEQEQRLRNRIAQLEQAKQRAPEVAAELARLQELLPADPELPAFIRLMQRVAEEAGVELRSIGPGLPAALSGNENVEVIQVSLSFEGGFRRVQDYLARLETMRRLVEIQTISLQPGADPETGQTTLQGNMAMRMFVLARTETPQEASA